MERLLVAYETVKMWLEATLSISQPVLHAGAGVLLYLIFTPLLRRRWGSFVPLAPVLAIELANEAADYWRYRLAGWPWTWWPTVGDITATIGPPLMMAIVLRWMRRAEATAQVDPVTP